MNVDDKQLRLMLWKEKYRKLPQTMLDWGYCWLNSRSGPDIIGYKTKLFGFIPWRKQVAKLEWWQYPIPDTPNIGLPFKTVEISVNDRELFEELLLSHLENCGFKKAQIY